MMKVRNLPSWVSAALATCFPLLGSAEGQRRPKFLWVGSPELRIIGIQPSLRHSQIQVRATVRTWPGACGTKRFAWRIAPQAHGQAFSNRHGASYSSGTNHKVWAAQITARHPTLVALGISSIKCGHDAPLYGVMRRHHWAAGHALFLLRRSRRKQALGLINIRVETIDYFLRRYREEVIRKRKAEQEVAAQLAEYENQLRGQSDPQPERQLENGPNEMAAD